MASTTHNIKVSHIRGRQSNNDIRLAWFSWSYAPTFHPHLSMFHVCGLFYGRRLNAEMQHHNFLISDFLECRWISHENTSHARSNGLVCRFWISFLPTTLTSRKRHTPLQPRFAQIQCRTTIELDVIVTDVEHSSRRKNEHVQPSENEHIIGKMHKSFVFIY